MPDNTDPLSKALQDVGDPPCDTCSLFQVCADQELACRAFWSYVSGTRKRKVQKGEPLNDQRTPTRALFNQIAEKERV